MHNDQTESWARVNLALMSVRVCGGRVWTVLVPRFVRCHFVTHMILSLESDSVHRVLNKMNAVDTVHYFASVNIVVY